MRTLVIAEPGGTAEGDYDRMVELLETAKACGADVWKPQWVSDAEQHLARRSARLNTEEKAAFYANYQTAYSWLQWPVEWHADFYQRCHRLGMLYGCSICLPGDAAQILPWVDVLKVSSFEAGAGFVDELVATERSTLVSLGLGGQESNPDAHYLHCVSCYPAPLEQLNLRAIDDMRRGYSDHSKDVRVGAWAVMRGALEVEAHYRLSTCNLSNPDYAVAFSPGEFAVYIQQIREAEVAMGDGLRRHQPCETPLLPYLIPDAAYGQS